jgi:hypothetical protein
MTCSETIAGGAIMKTIQSLERSVDPFLAIGVGLAVMFLVGGVMLAVG